MSVFKEPILSIPEDAGARLRQALGLGADAPVRIAYLAGPGDVFGTFQYWKQGRHDPRTPSIAYSTQFYEFCDAVGGEGVLITHSAEGAESIADGAYSFINLAYRPGSGGAGYFASRLKYALACLGALSRIKPHAVVAASDFDWQYLPFAKALTKRLVLSIHNTRWPMGRRPSSMRQQVSDALYGLAIKSVDAAVCTSHECERQVKSLAGESSATFVEAPQQAALADSARLARPTPPAGGGRLLFIGRLEPAKGVYDLFNAFRRLKLSRPDMELVYAGSGNALEPLRREVSLHKLEADVRLLGHLTSEEVHAEIEKADLVICPTRTDFNEGLALVCFEAAAHGVPPVMSSIVPAQDLLEGACAVYEADNAEALAETLSRVLDDSAHYEAMSALARKRAGMMLDRSLSWGTQLYRAMTAGAA